MFIHTASSPHAFRLKYFQTFVAILPPEDRYLKKPSVQTVGNNVTLPKFPANDRILINSQGGNQNFIDMDKMEWVLNLKKKK